MRSSSNSSSSSSYSLWGWLIYVSVHFVLAQAGACSPNNERFKVAMQSSGLTRVTKRGYDFFECGYGDVWVESFTAHHYLSAKSGEVVDATVEGTMCCGILKGCTIRWP